MVVDGSCLTRAGLVPCGSQAVEDLLCGVGWLGVGGEVMAVDVDGDFLKGFEFANHVFDGDAGGLLEVADDGQGGHDDGQVGLDGIEGVVEDRAGGQVVLGHAKRLLDVP